MEAVTAGVYDRPTGGLEGERGTIRSTMRCAPVNRPAVSVFPIRGLGITLASQAGGKENRPAVCQIAGRILGGGKCSLLVRGATHAVPRILLLDDLQVEDVLRLDLVDDLHTVDHPAEDRVPTIEMRLCRMADEPLAAAGVLAAVGDTNGAAFVG